MAWLQNRTTLLIFIIAIVAVSREALAVPAAPFLHQLLQPSGEAFAARQWGDEFRSGWETDSGYTIIFDQQQAVWAYAERDRNGELTASRRKVGRHAPTGLAKRVRPEKGHGLSRRERPFAGSPLVFSVMSGTAAVNFPSFDNSPQIIRNIPVILINFSDTTTAHSNADFATLLFSTGSMSFKDYFEEVSRGAFTVAPGPAGVQGWSTAANGHDYYGQSSGWGPPDKWPGDLAYEATSQVDAVVDFSAYDADGDCIVDVVAIVHQGTAQEASAATADIWSHSWSLSSTYGYGLGHHGAYTTNDICPTDTGRQMIVDDYIMMPETLPPAVDPGITSIGVFAHEYGHALGLIDLYDTDKSSEGAGNWSLMASGSWGRVARAGDRPSHLDPWSKRALGWIVPTLILTDETGKNLPAVESSGQVWQFREGSPALGGEYFLAENRRQSGFDAALPGAGLLLWHIDESRNGNTSEWYPGCATCYSHYKVALVQADNSYDLEQKSDRGDGGDPFPGTAGNRRVNHLTSPASLLYNGLPAGFALGAVSDAGQTMTVDIALADGVPPATTITAKPPLLDATATASFSFTAGENAIYDCRLDSSSYFSCSSPHVVPGLGDGTHTFTVRAIDQTGTIETAPPAYVWTVDTAPPETTLQSAPPALTASLSASFSFSSGDAGASFDCSLDNGPWTGCTSPLTLSGLAEGNHSFAVRAVDPAGNSDPSSAACTWAVARNLQLNFSGQPESYHVTLGAALSTVPSGTPVLLLTREVNISEDLVVARCAEVTLKGGHAPDFTTIVGLTTITGSVTVSCGSLVVNGLAIR